MSKTKKKKWSKAYNLMKTVKEQNIIQPKRTKTKKKQSKMLRWTESNNIDKKGPRLSKLRKVFAPAPPSLQAPPDIETIAGNKGLQTTFHP